MPAKHLLKTCLLLCLLVGFLTACDVLPKITFNGTQIASSSSNTPTSSIPPLNTWTQAAPGIEVRSEDWKIPGDSEDTVVITRLDLSRVHLSIGYQPDHPLTMSEWMQQTGAKALINGGYFDSNNQPEGLLVANGQTFGTSYNNFGGMLAVDTQGNVSLRSLHQQPYDPNNDQLQQATQSSPMLTLDGKRTQFDTNADHQRRSVVAIDTQGRLLLVVSSAQAFTLGELADLVSSSDLSIKTALNLDGGASTGLHVQAGSQKISLDSFTPLPIVIIVK